MIQFSCLFYCIFCMSNLLPKTVIVGNDHAGPEFVQDIIDHLKSQGYQVLHLGSQNEGSVDYPEYGYKTAQETVQKNAFGVVICGTGIGISIAANKVSKARCAHCISPYMAEMARKHNDANIIALGARILDKENAKTILDTFLTTEFEGGRHKKRVEQLNTGI